MSERPQPPVSPTVIQGLALVTALLGVAMIVLALLGGGGVGSYGVLIGALFVGAGVLRLKLLRGRARAAAQHQAGDGEPKR